LLKDSTPSTLAYGSAFPSGDAPERGELFDNASEIRESETHQKPVARVLIVEDQWLVAAEFESTLSDGGFEVVGIAASADEAVALCRTHRPDFALMDIRLIGRRDGVDAAADILSAFGIRSLFVTAHDDPQTRARAAGLQPLDWLVKPVPSRRLLEAVQRAISNEP
jgi:two-component system, response regulator PdtaR